MIDSLAPSRKGPDGFESDDSAYKDNILGFGNTTKITPRSVSAVRQSEDTEAREMKSP